MNIEIDDQVYSIAPNFNRNRDLFFVDIKSRLCKFKIIIGGDFNEVLRPGDRMTTSNINKVLKGKRSRELLTVTYVK